VSIVTTIAGTGTGSYSGDGGAATSAAINYPYGIVCDSSGNIYFAEYSNHRVRKVNPSTGIITTYVGTGSAGFSGDTGAATSATLYGPTGMAIDSSNNLYIAIDQSCRIRKVTVSTGIITTVAGNGAYTYSGDGGQATSAGFSHPLGVAVNSDNNIFIPDNNHRIRKVTVSTGIITTIAGTGSSGYSGDGGAATAAAICLPGNINLDTAGNIYFGDHSGYNVVRKITVSTGVISTVAGTGSTSGGYNGDNIQATAATLSYPNDVVIDSAGNLYIGDAFNYRIRKVTVSTGIITTIAGTGSSGYSGDGGVATSASFMLGHYLRFDSTGSLYVTDTYSNRVRKIAFYTPTSAPSYVPSSDPTSALPTATPSYTPTTAVPTSAMNIITTIAGSSTSAGYSGDDGQATAATLNYPHGLAVDTSGNVYIADRSNHRIRKVTISTGIITKLAGTGFESNSGDGGAATSAGLEMPTAVSLDSSGNIYIADTYNYVIRKITVATGIITRFAGGNGYSGGDGGAATSAGLDGPYGVIVDTTNDYVYIAAYTNHRVRKVVIATGIITTAAGSGSNSYSGDGGQATSAGVSQPYGVAVDSSGNIYATSGNRIRKVTVSTGIISTVAGTGTSSYSGDGGQATSATLSNACGVVVDSAGNIYIADTNNHRIRKVTVSTGIISTIAGTGTSSYSGDGGPATSASLQYPVRIAIDSSGNLYFADTNNHRIRKITLGGSFGPTPSPSMSPTATPTKAPSYTPTILPTAPTCVPTNTPTNRPSAPSGQPSSQPTRQPTTQPSRRPSSQPSSQPTVRPTMKPTAQPSSQPTSEPSAEPSNQPSSRPSSQPSTQPSARPSVQPSR
jgi:sugar lactone lactonase YvrE